MDESTLMLPVNSKMTEEQIEKLSDWIRYYGAFDAFEKVCFVTNNKTIVINIGE